MFKKFVHRPVLSIVLSIMITLLGVIALIQLPVTQFPSISPPKVNVTAEYPGANGELMVKAVVIPIERAINGVPGIKYIASDAGNDGTATVQIIFNSGVDPNVASLNIQNRVASVINKLPPIVVREGVKISREESNMLMYVNLFSDNATLDEKFLFNFADINLISELRSVDGVGLVDVLGNREYAMRIWLKPDRMLAYKISADEVLKALDEQSLEASPGRTGEASGKRSQAFEYVLKYPGRFTTKEGYENIILRSTPEGEILRVKDVADVEFGSSYYDIYSKLNGKRSAAIVIKQAYGSNAQEVIQRVKAKLAEIKASSFPAGMDYEISYDVSKFLDASIEKVIHTLVEAFILVAFVVLLFLGDWRSTLIPAIAVPVSLIGTFLFMMLFNITLNLITLFALVLAIGIVVDNAIVVVEAVHAKMEEKHLSPVLATEEAMHEISGAIIAITLVMAAVFIPVAFMKGPVGIFYRQFSITMSTSIILSGLVALTLTPALCASLLKPHQSMVQKRSLFSRVLFGFNAWFNRILGKYQNTIAGIVSKRVITMVFLFAFCLGAYLLNTQLPAGFIPNEDQGTFYAIVQTPPGATLERTDDVVRQLQKIAQKIEGIKSVSSLAGYEVLSEGTGANTGTCLVNLKSWNERKHTMQQIIVELEEKAKDIKGANLEFFPPPAVPGYGAAGGFELRLLDKTGSGSFKDMEQASQNLVNALSQRKELTSVFSFYSASYPQYMLLVDNELAQQKGVTIENAMNTLSTLVGSNYETNFIRFGRQYKVMVQALPQYRALPEDILKLYVKNDRNEMVPFSAFMHLQKVYGLSEITRHNLYNASEISGSPAPGYSSGAALKVVQQVAQKTLPRGYGIDWAGISKDEAAQGNTAIYIFMVSLIFVYLLLSAQYESFILPLSVILSLPAGVFGAFLLLKILGLENNIYAQVALVMLIGLLGKNAVLIVEFAAQKHAAGKSVLQASVEGAAARFRPILMTSFAFIAGLLPLLFSTGPGAVGNRTIGAAAAGGMLIGTLGGIFFIPGLYYLFAKIAETKPIVAGQYENPLTEEFDNNEPI